MLWVDWMTRLLDGQEAAVAEAEPLTTAAADEALPATATEEEAAAERPP